MKYLSNPAFIMPALILGATLIYFLYYAVDKVGLATTAANAVVTDKTFTQGSTTYVNRIAGGRSWTQAQQQPDYYAISIEIKALNNEPSVALVTKDKFDRLTKGDQVRITFHRTRITGRIEVVDLN